MPRGGGGALSVPVKAHFSVFRRRCATQLSYAEALPTASVAAPRRAKRPQTPWTSVAYRRPVPQSAVSRRRRPPQSPLQASALPLSPTPASLPSRSRRGAAEGRRRHRRRHRRVSRRPRSGVAWGGGGRRHNLRRSRRPCRHRRCRPHCSPRRRCGASACRRSYRPGHRRARRRPRSGVA